MASAANVTLVGVFRSVVVPADGHQRCQLKRAGTSARRRFLGSSRASTDLPVPLYVWCHDQSTMVRQEILLRNSGEAVAVLAATPDNDGSRPDVPKKAKALCPFKRHSGCGYGVCRFSICS